MNTAQSSPTTSGQGDWLKGTSDQNLIRTTFINYYFMKSYVALANIKDLIYCVPWRGMVLVQKLKGREPVSPDPLHREWWELRLRACSVWWGLFGLPRLIPATTLQRREYKWASAFLIQLVISLQSSVTSTIELAFQWNHSERVSTLRNVLSVFFSQYIKAVHIIIYSALVYTHPNVIFFSQQFSSAL